MQAAARLQQQPGSLAEQAVKGARHVQEVEVQVMLSTVEAGWALGGALRHARLAGLQQRKRSSWCAAHVGTHSCLLDFEC